METEACAPLLRAVVVKKIKTGGEVRLVVRYHRGGIFAKKIRSFSVYIKKADQKKNYEAAIKLLPGDEIIVDPYGEQFDQFTYHNGFSRWINLLFY